MHNFPIIYKETFYKITKNTVFYPWSRVRIIDSPHMRFWKVIQKSWTITKDLSKILRPTLVYNAWYSTRTKLNYHWPRKNCHFERPWTTNVALSNQFKKKYKGAGTLEVRSVCSSITWKLPGGNPIQGALQVTSKIRANMFQGLQTLQGLQKNKTSRQLQDQKLPG